MMIDFDIAEEKINKYLDSEKKTTIMFNNNLYMLKYPDPVRSEKNKKNLSYKNNQFSEYIGCKIFKSCGFNTQDTLLGYFTDTNNKKKIVVACKDFTQNGDVLYEFAKIANQAQVDGTRRNISIEDIYSIISEMDMIKNKNEIISCFWDMFAIDALIGNRDRHFGNWGLIESISGDMSFAPIYDCGSSLSALLDDDNMERDLNDPIKFKQNNFNVTSCYHMNNKRIFYHEIFKEPPEDLKEAIKRIVPKINMDKIRNIIDATPEMPDIRKEYLKKAVEIRYEQILAPALNRILKQERTQIQAKTPQSRPDDEIEGDFFMENLKKIYKTCPSKRRTRLLQTKPATQY